MGGIRSPSSAGCKNGFATEEPGPLATRKKLSIPSKGAVSGFLVYARVSIGSRCGITPQLSCSRVTTMRQRAKRAGALRRVGCQLQRSVRKRTEMLKLTPEVQERRAIHRETAMARDARLWEVDRMVKRETPGARSRAAAIVLGGGPPAPAGARGELRNPCSFRPRSSAPTAPPCFPLDRESTRTFRSRAPLDRR
jgi:hypothetical protein